MRTWRTSFLIATWTAGTLLFFAFATPACRSKECTPGQQIACACPDGRSSAQVCDQDGARFLPCACPAATSGGVATTSPAAMPASTARATTNSEEGTDARNPVLPPEDATFVDIRGGMGWNDRCWINLKKGKYGWAKAECDMALKMNPASPMPMASILYNHGLIQKAAGNVEAARQLFEQSLELREHPEVRAALLSLPGDPQRPAKKIACGRSTCDSVCCATFDMKCASKPEDCERAGNGEGTIYECDGPEDCRSGEVCCLVPMDRTTASYCMARAKCTGEYQHPRYQTTIPLQFVCHSTADCAGGHQCSSGGAESLSTCK
jgi:hypothetical protein